MITGILSEPQSNRGVSGPRPCPLKVFRFSSDSGQNIDRVNNFTSDCNVCLRFSILENLKI